MTIELKVLLYLYEHAGSNQHDIANACSVSPYDAFFMGAIETLHDLKLISNESAFDHPQMEFYYKWYLTKDGEKVVKYHLTAQG